VRHTGEMLSIWPKILTCTRTGVLCRSLRESLADPERATGGEEKDVGTEADSESAVQRDTSVPRRRRTAASHQPVRPRHGLRPDRPQRGDRPRPSWIAERSQRAAALERDAGEGQVACHQVARTQTV